MWSIITETEDLKEKGMCCVLGKRQKKDDVEVVVGV
jgi:hypothetical protein